ncbi:MAG TPA: Arc family DNA-binding protein [Terrimicrobiaceae bacterium]
MATLTIRNLPTEVHARLREQARRNRRSLNQEIIAELARVTGESEADRVVIARERMRQAIRETEKVRAGMKRFMTAEEIDEAIKEGRP